MALSYEFSIGSVRARENSLLKSSDIEQMLNMKNEEELIRFLKDKGFGDGNDTEAIIADNTQKMWKFIHSVAPDADIFEPFYLQNDIHNLKTVLKGMLSDTDYRALLLSPYTIDPVAIRKALENNRFDTLPPWLAEPAEMAYRLLTRTGDARLSDAVIDKAALGKMLEAGKASHSVFLEDYFRIYVFYANVKTAIRAARIRSSQNYLETALCKCDGFDTETVIKKALSSKDALFKYLSSLSIYDCKEAMAHFEKSPCEFEKFVENKLIALARKECRISCRGPEALFGYYLGCQAQCQAVHIIASGIVTQTSPDKIRERLRETYG